jgi:NADH dehydrogenase
MTRILLLGGTGFIGRSVCERLVRRGQGAAGRLIVPTRRQQHANAVRALPGTEVLQVDLHDDAQLRRLLADCDVVVNLVGVLHGDAAAFQRAHVDLPRRIAQMAQALGGRRVLHVSALGVGPNAPSRYLRSKTEGEAALRASGLPLTLLRPSVVFGAEDRFLNLFAALQRVLPVMLLAGAEARFQPVWVEDVAEAIVRAIDTPASIGAVYECAGPQVFSLRELVQLAGRWAGHPRPVIGLPGPLGRMQATLLGLWPAPLMSRDNLDSMATPNVAGGELPGLTALGIRPAALSQVVPDDLGGRSGCARLDALRAAGRRG